MVRPPCLENSVRKRGLSEFSEELSANRVASMPKLPHRDGGDSTAIHARSMKDMWTRYVEFDSLPQILNPRGGYVRNENDSPWFTNLRQRLGPAVRAGSTPAVGGWGSETRARGCSVKWRG